MLALSLAQLSPSLFTNVPNCLPFLCSSLTYKECRSIALDLVIDSVCFGKFLGVLCSGSAQYSLPISSIFLFLQFLLQMRVCKFLLHRLLKGLQRNHQLEKQVVLNSIMIDSIKSMFCMSKHVFSKRWTKKNKKN